MEEPTFPETCQLNDDLQCVQAVGVLALKHTREKTSTLPGQPRVRLDHTELHRYLKDELLVPQLDQMAPRLWLVCQVSSHSQTCGSSHNRQVSTPRSSHISPLHHQAVRGRTIILIENPQLHLVWYYNQIFIKPIPNYLLSYAFWQYLATLPPQFRQSALGFMRTYSHLIRYEADFRLAQEKGLLPKSESSDTGKNQITFETFANLIAWFDRLDDESVVPRYGYGELRLTRLNFYTRIFLRKLTFHHMDAQLGTFLNHAVAPFITGFIVISVILNAMQVELAAQATNDFGTHWAKFASLSRWVSVVALGIAAFVTVFVLSLIGILFLHNMWFAMKMVRKKKDWKVEKSCVV